MYSLHQAILEALEPRTYLTTLYWHAGSSDWDRTTANWNTAADGSGSQVTWTNGDDAVFNATATVNITDPDLFYGTVTVSGGSLTLTGDAGLEYGSLNWTGGNVTLQTTLYAVDLTLDGGSDAFTLDGANGGYIYQGSVAWNSGNFIATGGGYIFNGGNLTLDGGSNTFTLDGSSLEKDYEFGGSAEWDSGTLVLTDGANFNLDDESGGPSSNTFAIGEDDTVTLDMSSGSSITHDENVSIVNYGTINWTGSDTDQLANITNDGVIYFDTGSNPDLISLSGSSTATEGSTYTLTLGSVSGDISDSVDAFAVDWGDGIGYDTFTSAGTVTHTYGGSPSSSTSYTIAVHLITDNGVYVAAATKDVTVNNAIQAPTGLSVSLGDTGADLSWTNHSTSAATNEVEIQYSGSSEWQVLASLSSTANSYDSSIMLDDCTFRVRAVGNGESAYSSNVSYTGTTQYAGEGDATDLSISYNTSLPFGENGYATLTFNHQSGSAADYTIWYKKISDTPADSQWTEVTEVYDPYNPADGSSTTASINIDGGMLTWPGGVDIVVVSSLDNKPSNIITGQLQTTLTTPTGVTVTAEGGDLFLIQWTPTLDSGDSTGAYNIYGTTSDDYEDDLHVLATVSGPTTDSYYLQLGSSGSNAYAPYAFFAVQAVDSTGNSDLSTPVDAAAPATPANFNAVALGTGAVGLTWNAEAYADGYIIKRSTTDSGDPSTWTTLHTVSNSSDNSYIDTSAAAGTTYYYAIEAYHTGTSTTGYSAFTTPVSVVTSGDNVNWSITDLTVTRGTPLKVVATKIAAGSSDRLWPGGVTAFVCDATGSPVTVAGLSITRTANGNGSAKFTVTAAAGVPATAPGTKYYLKFVDDQNNGEFTVEELVVK